MNLGFWRVLAATMSLCYITSIHAVELNVTKPINLPDGTKHLDTYNTCFQANINSLKPGILNSQPEHSRIVVRDYCSCVSPYIDDYYSVKFSGIFSCIKEKSRGRKLNSEEIKNAITKECGASSQHQLKLIMDKMKANCKASQDEFEKIFDKTKQCGEPVKK